MYACELSTPIDSWTGWRAVEIATDNDRQYICWAGVPNEVTRMYYELLRACPSASSKLRKIRYVGLPPRRNYCEGGYLVAVKIDDNGDTFLISDELLPWVGNLEKWIEIKD